MNAREILRYRLPRREFLLLTAGTLSGAGVTTLISAFTMLRIGDDINRSRNVRPKENPSRPLDPKYQERIREFSPTPTQEKQKPKEVPTPRTRTA